MFTKMDGDWLFKNSNHHKMVEFYEDVNRYGYIFYFGRPREAGGGSSEDTLPAGQGAGLEEVRRAWEGVAATPAYAGVGKGVMPIFLPGTEGAMPTVAAKTDLHFGVVTETKAGLEEIETLLRRLGVAADRWWGLVGTPEMAVKVAAAEFPSSSVYLVDPSRPDWLKELLDFLGEIGILLMGGLEEAIQATEEYFQFA
jgi:hypothetical protein